MFRTVFQSLAIPERASLIHWETVRLSFFAEGSFRNEFDNEDDIFTGSIHTVLTGFGFSESFHDITEAILVHVSGTSTGVPVLSDFHLDISDMTSEKNGFVAEGFSTFVIGFVTVSEAFDGFLFLNSANTFETFSFDTSLIIFHR